MVWINGSGKTTTAQRIVETSDLRLFDPESVGFLLRDHLRDVEMSDFGDLAPWRALVPAVADELARFTGDNLMIVQTVLDQGCWQALASGLATRGHELVHVVLDADPATLRRRIEADAEARDWRLRHLVTYVESRAWMLVSADLVLDTSTLTADDVADAILELVVRELGTVRDASPPRRWECLIDGPPGLPEQEVSMSLWLILIIVGVILAIIGFAGVGQILIWIGVAVLVIGLILSFTGRRGRV